MQRRNLIALLGSGIAMWPLGTNAQPLGIPVVGYLSSRSRERDAPFLAAFLKGLKETGFAEGQNVAIEYRWADGDNERLREYADEERLPQRSESDRFEC